MKTLKQTIILLIMIFLAQTGYSQFAAVKSFDYSLLEKKVLYIPTYEASKKYIKRMSRRGKFDKIKDVKAKAEHYNTIWREAMAESSYDATDYEIKAFNRKKLIKSKNRKAIILYYSHDDYGNTSVNLMITYPKRRVIAHTIINGFDLSTKQDVRLMMNLLNESLITASELEEEGNKTYSGKRNKYKEGVVAFYDDIDGKIFLVPKSEHKKKKKAAARTADLREALKSWKLSEYKLTTNEEIEKKRVDGDHDCYYWRDVPYYTNNPLLVYHLNYILSTDGDDVLIVFLGKKRLKASTLEKIQKKIVSKATKYKKQLEKK